MRVLLIEDNQSFVMPLREFTTGEGIDLDVASDLRSARERLEGPSDVDLVLCDLKIPSEPGLLDAEVAHGLAALRLVQRTWHGVPVVVISAFGTLDVMSDMLLEAHQLDVFGSREPLPMLRFKQKADLASAMALVAEAKRELNELDGIEVLGADSLNHSQRRSLRIFARRRDGRQVRFRPLTAGRSGSNTGIAEVRNEQGAQVAHVVAKLSSLQDTTEEKLAYQQIVAGRLGAGTYANLSDEVLGGCHDSAGLFYSVADSYDRDLFAVLRDEPELGAGVVGRLRDATEPWIRGVAQRSASWSDLRRSLVSDVQLAAISREFEFVPVPDDKHVQVVWAPQHGDLHAGNVLVDRTGRPVLIDFGRAGFASSVLDPVTLELSAAFHPDSPFRDRGWPDAAAVAQWWNLEEYAANCPAPDFIRGCRAWALALAAGERDLLATVNAFCLRNLRFADNDRDVVLALQRVIAARLLAA